MGRTYQSTDQEKCSHYFRLEGVHYLWARIWNGKCWQSGYHAQGSLWWKTSGRGFRNHLRSFIQLLNFASCPADPDVWMRPAIKSDGSKCYDYVLLYVDDALVVCEKAESILRNELGRYFELEEEFIGPPDHYLGGKVRKVQLENGVYAWAFSSSQYVQTAVKNVEAYLMSEDTKHWKMPNKAETPLTTTYRSELDISRELNEADAAYYQSLNGILRWIVELGQVDVCLEVSMMSSHLALPREGHWSKCYTSLLT